MIVRHRDDMTRIGNTDSPAIPRSILRLASETRRGFVRTLLGAAAALRPFRALGARTDEAFTVVTLGDSILDCAHYNAHGMHPGALLVRNDDDLFPDYAGRDLRSCRPANLLHRARDGARIDDLPRQAQGLDVQGPAVALLTIGGNDLLGGLAGDDGSGIARFRGALDAFLTALPLRPVLVATVYDPTFNDDTRNFLNVDPRLARANLERMNAALADVATRHGELVDLHAHFLTGDPTWFTRTIEPSLVGASEIRAAFLPGVLRTAGCSDVSKSPARPRYRTPTPS
jgi:hypothetical protein